MTTIPPPYTVLDIADWFLAKAKSEGKYLKPMKLQKLVYFAYGWCSAYFGQFLFPETIYAFKHGPVVQELFDRFRYLKGNSITEDIVQKVGIDTDVESLLDSVWKAYEPYTDNRINSGDRSFIRNRCGIRI